MAIVRQIVPTRATIPDLDHLTGIGVDGNHAVPGFGFDAEDSGQIFGLGTDPFQDLTGYLGQSDLGLLRSGQAVPSIVTPIFSPSRPSNWVVNIIIKPVTVNMIRNGITKIPA